MAKTGHYGKPALIIAIAAVVALVVHLAVPYGYLVVGGGGDADDNEAVSRSEVRESEDAFNGSPATTGVTLTGIILTLVAGLALVALGFMPMGVSAARWTGWGLAAFAAVGGLLTFLSSMYWVGSGPGYFLASASVFGAGLVGGGFTGMIEVIAGTDTAANLWVISPVIVAVLSGVVLWMALRLAGEVVKTEHGWRARARAHLRGAKWAIALVALALLVPWSIVKNDVAPDDEAPFFYGAHSIVMINDVTQPSPEEEEWFNGMSFAIGVFIATAWVGLAAAFAGAAGGVLASTGAPVQVSRGTHYAVVATLAMLVWSAIMYVLAWSILWKPAESVEATPGWFPAALIAVFALWGMNAATLLRHVPGASGDGARTAPEPVSFD